MINPTMALCRVLRSCSQLYLPLAFALVALLPAAATLAQEEEVKHDARLDGFPQNVSIGNDSTALMWLLLVFLGILTLSVMFKNARRSHLD